MRYRSILILLRPWVLATTTRNEADIYQVPGKSPVFIIFLYLIPVSVLRIRDVYPGSRFFEKLSKSSSKYGLRIRDPRSGIWKKPIPDPGSRIQGSKRHRIPDPDPQHWPVNSILILFCSINCFIFLGSGIWDPGWVKGQDPDPGSRRTTCCYLPKFDTDPYPW